MLKSLTKKLPGKQAVYQTRLIGIDGFTGAGDFQYSIFRNGHRAYRVDLRGVAGKAAEIYVASIKVARLTLDNGRAAQKFDTRRGDPAPALEASDKVEIRQNGQVILAGELVPAKQ